MNYALVFRPEVREELDEAYSWYESQQAGLGDEEPGNCDSNFSQSARSKILTGANLTTLLQRTDESCCQIQWR